MKYLVSPIILTLCCTIALARQNWPNNVSQEPTTKSQDDNKVYSPQEVDTKAVIKNRNKLDPPCCSSDCPDGVTLVLKVVLHKSGKVTEVQVLQPINCSFQDKAIKRVQQIKFTPALKDGVSVSQYQLVQFNFNKH